MSSQVLRPVERLHCGHGWQPVRHDDHQHEPEPEHDRDRNHHHGRRWWRHHQHRWFRGTIPSTSSTSTTKQHHTSSGAQGQNWGAEWFHFPIRNHNFCGFSYQMIQMVFFRVKLVGSASRFQGALSNSFLGIPILILTSLLPCWLFHICRFMPERCHQEREKVLFFIGMIFPRHGLTCLSPKTTDLSTAPKKHQALSLWWQPLSVAKKALVFVCDRWLAPGQGQDWACLKMRIPVRDNENNGHQCGRTSVFDYWILEAFPKILQVPSCFYSLQWTQQW